MAINRVKALDFEITEYFYGVMGIRMDGKVEEMKNTL